MWAQLRLLALLSLLRRCNGMVTKVRGSLLRPLLTKLGTVKLVTLVTLKSLLSLMTIRCRDCVSKGKDNSHDAAVLTRPHLVFGFQASWTCRDPLRSFDYTRCAVRRARIKLARAARQNPHPPFCAHPSNGPLLQLFGSDGGRMMGHSSTIRTFHSVYSMIGLSLVPHFRF